MRKWLGIKYGDTSCVGTYIIIISKAQRRVLKKKINIIH